MKVKDINWKKLLVYGLVFWLIINLLQAIFTEINSDEAYYALYGENLAWGYFDHPPMVALLTYLSSILFSGTLGVRFCTVLLSCTTIFITWKIIDEKYPDTNKMLLFLTITFSMAMFNVYSFITTPDCPLIFFSTLFLLVYQKYLYDNSLSNGILLGLIMAAMIYSKYHAILFLGLIVISNPKLFTQRNFWIGCLWTIVLLIPHFLWQYNNDFPSLKYHLISRVHTFRWRYLIEYIPNQFLIFNPLTYLAVMYLLFNHHNKNVFERGLKFVIIGFFFFFFAMTVRGHVEPHWTVVCTVPIIILLYRYSLQNDKLKLYIKRFVLPSLIILFILRILIVTPYSPKKMQLYGKNKYYTTIQKIAKDKPVVFQSSFQKPSLYHFFTGDESTTLSSLTTRRTQFDIWQKDIALQGKTAFICTHIPNLSKKYSVNGISVEGYITNNFQSVNRIKIDYSIEGQYKNDIPTIQKGDTINISYIMSNSTDKDIDFQHNEFPVSIYATLIKGDNIELIPCIIPNKIYIINKHSQYNNTLKIVVPNYINKGKYKLCLCLNNNICFTNNSNIIEVLIK